MIYVYQADGRKLSIACPEPKITVRQLAERARMGFKLPPSCELMWVTDDTPDGPLDKISDDMLVEDETWWRFPPEPKEKEITRNTTSAHRAIADLLQTTMDVIENEPAWNNENLKSVIKYFLSKVAATFQEKFIGEDR